MREIEDGIDLLKRKASLEVNDLRFDNENNINQIKHFYEIERQTIERRLVEEKQRYENKNFQLIEEYEQRIREEEMVIIYKNNFFYTLFFNF